ncbi:MAG TPA: carboxypeptidase regulatory-like domain-containing protein [Planctomycetota bacterium]|nr:carboxypeptidase regulatory-like domain-containing protein [Planctomycetota bacterium]
MPSTAARPVLVLCLTAALLLACWPWLFAPESSPVDASPAPARHPTTATSPIDRAATPATSADAAAATTAEREVAPTASATEVGSLLVHVVWGDDKQPAEGIEVKVWRSGVDPLFDEPQARSDATGSVLFAELAPGNVYLSVERAGHGDHVQVTIVAGQRSEVTLEVKMGMNAKGRVVDGSGAGVAGADIVVSGWAGGKTLTLGQSGADGTFEVRAVATHCHIGARKEGFVPSSMRQFTAADGATVDFTIVLTGTGASLEGVVLDPHDRPIADAIVMAGERDQKNHKLPDGANAMAPQCEQVRTDEAGRFRFTSVAPGLVPVSACARGLAPWHQDVEVRAGSRESLTIRLQPGVTLFGRVRDAAGKALAKVEIHGGDWDKLGHRSASSAEDGTYRLEGLAVGTLQLQASHDEHGTTSESFVFVAGEQRRWDPILSAGLQIRGRVVDDDDKPVKGVMVEAMLERRTRDDHWSGFENTDAEGRFVLNNCKEGKSIRVTFRRKSTFPELVMTGVLPSSEDLVVRLPKEAWVYIRGTVLGPDGEVLPNVHVSPSMKVGYSGSPAETVDDKTGAFNYGPYPPGTYSIRFSADGYPPIRLEDRVLGPDEVWDVGTVKFERGGTLAVQLVAATELPAKWALTIYDEKGARVGQLDTNNGAGRSSPLVPGNYVLQVGGDKLACSSHPFEIRAGQETRLDIPVRTGIATTIDFSFPQGAEPLHSVTLELRDPQNVVVWRGRAWGRDDKVGVSLTLAPGDYTIEATCEDLRASGTLAVAPGRAMMTLELRKP